VGVLVDTTPLRVSPDFRRLWVGQAVSVLGSMITTAALPYQVFHRTGSTLAVGLLGAVQLVPMLVFPLWGGALADALDKRRVLLGVNVAAMACAASLALNASLGRPQVWVLFVLGAASSCMFGLSYPTLRAYLPLLLPPELRPAGYALQSTYGTFGMMAGPALAGLLIAGLGLTWAYSLDVVTYGLALVAFAGLAPSPPAEGAAKASRSSVLEGLRFLRGHAVVLSTFGLDLMAMVCGMPKALFPALAEQLGGGATLYGLLLSAVAAGAFLASVTSGWTSHVVRQGRAVLACVAVWGAAIAVAGLVHASTLVLLLLAVAGGADMVSGVFRSAIAADVTPDALRGRVSGVEFMVYAGGPVLGDVEAGVVGGLVGIPFAIVSGGVLCMVGALAFQVFVPRFADHVRPDATAVLGAPSTRPGR
jgi:MFS family permease